MKYLQESLPNKAKLGLYFNPFGKVLELIDDCIAAGVDQLISEQPWPETEADFSAVKEKVRAELGETVLRIALKVEQILTQGHEIQKKLKGKVELKHVQGQGEIKQHLDSLLFKGFVSTHGAARLDAILRYLQALQKRQEKLPVDPNRDRLMSHEYQKAEEAYQSLLGKYAGRSVPQAVLDVRWMLEELKVSLYAQTLGTPYPVSVKRILLAVSELK